MNQIVALPGKTELPTLNKTLCNLAATSEIAEQRRASLHEQSSWACLTSRLQSCSLSGGSQKIKSIFMVPAKILY